jgi:Arc/MetJ-type ribon-helix-helix transcriptional regulator
MTSLNVKIPNEMEDEINKFLESHPYYMNKSELVRDALRHIMYEERTLSEKTLKVIEKGKEQIKKDEGTTLEQVREELDG